MTTTRRLPLLSLAAFALALPLAAQAADLTYYAGPETPVYAPHPMVTGDVAGALGWLGSSTGASTGLATLGARVNFQLHDDWYLTPDVGLATAFDPSITIGGGVAHLYKKTASADWGVFAGGYATSAPSLNTNTFVLGGEVAFYHHPNSILSLQAAYGWVSDGTGFPQIRGTWDYYFTPDFKATAELAWTGGYSGGPDGVVGSLALTKRWADTPLSTFVAGALTSAGSSTGYAGIVGLSWMFDAPNATLYDHDRSIPFNYAITVY